MGKTIIGREKYKKIEYISTAKLAFHLIKSGFGELVLGAAFSHMQENLKFKNGEL